MAKERKTQLRKAQLIELIAQEMTRSKIIVVTDYRGLPAKELTTLRRVVSKADGRYMVVKNTLATFAAKKAGNEEIIKLLTGPVGLAFGYGDVTQTVKAIQEHIRSTGSVLQIRGGVLGKQALDRNAVLMLASLPPREVIVAQALAALKSPIQRLHFVLSSPVRQLLGVLQARAKQLESGGAAVVG